MKKDPDDDGMVFLASANSVQVIFKLEGLANSERDLTKLGERLKWPFEAKAIQGLYPEVKSAEIEVNGDIMTLRIMLHYGADVDRFREKIKKDIHRIQKEWTEILTH